MQTFKRISASISAQINSLVDQIENHEAVADVALQDIRESLMKAKFQIRRVQNEQKAFEDRLKELKSEETRWAQRAQQAQSKDHEQALECVRRMKRTRDDIASVSHQLTEHSQLEKQLTVDVGHIESKFEELKRKRSLLAARESRSEALSTVAQHQNATKTGGVFERWERKILRCEVAGESDLKNTDAFEAQFSEQEERAQLEAMLEDLVGKKS